MQRFEKQTQGTKNGRTAIRQAPTEPPIHILLGLFVSVSRYLRQTKRIKTLMFTCLFICAIHIELSNFVDTSFILLALQKCIGRSGDIWQIGSKNGSNQFEAVKKFPKPFQDMNCSRINEYLQVHGADQIIWINNPSEASRMGGVQERQIKTILNALAKIHWTNLDNELLRTLLVEVESIIKSRLMKSSVTPRVTFLYLQITSDLKTESNITHANHRPVTRITETFFR